MKNKSFLNFIYLFSIICATSNSLSQSNKLGFYIITELVTKECQACFKTYQFRDIDCKFDYNNCPANDCYSRAHCINTFTLIQWMDKSPEYIGIVMDCEKIRTSTCSESNSGKHLWKQINKQKASSTELIEVDISKTNHCEILENLNWSNDMWKQFALFHSVKLNIK